MPVIDFVLSVCISPLPIVISLISCVRVWVYVGEFVWWNVLVVFDSVWGIVLVGYILFVIFYSSLDFGNSVCRYFFTEKIPRLYYFLFSLAYWKIENCLDSWFALICVLSAFAALLHDVISFSLALLESQNRAIPDVIWVWSFASMISVNGVKFRYCFYYVRYT